MKNIVYLNMSIGVNFFLKELPLLIDSAKILNVDTSLFIYHSIPEGFRELYSKNLFNIVSKDQGFLCVSFN